MIRRIESEACPPRNLLLKYFVRRPPSSEVEVLRRWIEAGAPEGDVAVDVLAERLAVGGAQEATVVVEHDALAVVGGPLDPDLGEGGGIDQQEGGSVRARDRGRGHCQDCQER